MCLLFHSLSFTLQEVICFSISILYHHFNLNILNICYNLLLKYKNLVYDRKRDEVNALVK